MVGAGSDQWSVSNVVGGRVLHFCRSVFIFENGWWSVAHGRWSVVGGWSVGGGFVLRPEQIKV